MYWRNVTSSSVNALIQPLVVCVNQTTAFSQEIFRCVSLCIYHPDETIRSSSNCQRCWFDMDPSWPGWRYSIAGCIHYGKWGKRSYAPCLALTTTIIVGNWGVYQYDHWAQLKLGLVAMSMHYRYIEGLFIVCAWIPLACSMLSLPDRPKSVKQVRFSQSWMTLSSYSTWPSWVSRKCTYGVYIEINIIRTNLSAKVVIPT